MRPTPRGIALVLAAVSASCANPPEEAPPESTAAVVSTELSVGVPLKSIMAGLATDMASVASGIWFEDTTVIADAAESIAGHPRVPPEQVAAIQAALGDEFQHFVAFDQLVHDRAVQLQGEATASQPMADLARTYFDVAEGCVACHTAFRGRLSSVLAATPPGN